MGWLELFQNDIDEELQTHKKVGHNISVLVVDDEEHIVNTIEKYLSFNQYTVFMATNGIEALEIYRSNAPQIIISDMFMPGLNGLDLLQDVRKNDSETEFIMLTGNSDMAIAIKALKENASDFLIKPVDLEVLLHSVQKAETRISLKENVKKYTAELEELFAEVHHSREYLETVLENSPNATITYDSEGVITSWNDAAWKVTGYTKNEAIGKTVKEIFIFDKHLTTEEGKSTHHNNIIGQILTKGQQMRQILRNANHLRDANDNIIGGIESFYDITEKANDDRLLEKRYLQVQTINEIGKKVAESSSVSALINFICQRLVDTFLESANIFFILKDEENEQLVLKVGAGITIETVLQEHPLDSVLPADSGFLANVINNGETVLYRDVKKAPDFEKGFSRDVFSVFAFPIHSTNRKYGLLYIENSAFMELDDGDIFMMETIAEYLAISLEKLKMLDKITSQNQLLEKQAVDLKKAFTEVEKQKITIEKQNDSLLKDLHKAGEFQKSLMPEYLPSLEKFKFGVSFSPSNQLGGDYYDIFMIDERFLGVLIADASGHGVASAMLSAMFKMTIGKYAFTDLNPAGVFAKLNHDFCQVVQTGDFFTSFYGLIDLHENTFIYSNAAHPLPLLYNYKTKQIEELDSEGFLLGVMDNGITYEKKSVQFDGQYRLLLYTDGLIEEVNPNNEQYGEERVKEDLIKYANLDKDTYIKTVIKNLKQHTQTNEFEDDLTLVVVDILPQ